ncbi:filamentous hemagglutinin N-terminal domain-containing protein [Cyanobacteria bacterium FACHB-502]|nr:filamentous hemagglutinin N-terminal domain-containing protein [Cyanobacteria bacterium FACHB-502]
MYRKSWRLSLFGLVWLLGLGVNEPIAARPVPDETLGEERSRVVDRSERDFTIEGGARRGNNLFHSFREFNVEVGGGVYFFDPGQIENILTRVTGENPSNINGVLGTFGLENGAVVRSGANLYLMNPNGILFGPNAMLDIGGSFVGTTSNAIGFGEGKFFSATNPEIPSQLLTVDPSAFLFNQIPTGNITNRSIASSGSTPAGFAASGLRVPDGESLLLLGGNIEIDGGRLNAFGGQIELGGLAEAGTVGLNQAENTLSFNFSPNSALANVALANDARVAVRGGGDGDIVVNANEFTATDGGRLVAGIETTGNAGNIVLNANQIDLARVGLAGTGAGIYQEVLAGATGNTGNIEVNTRSLSITSGGGIGTQIRLGGTGNAGNITIIAPEAIELTGTSPDGQFRSSLFSGSEGAGNTGSLFITTGLLSLSEGSQLITLTANEGQGGDITINADTIELIGTSANEQFRTGIGSATNGSGRAGNTRINTGHLSVQGGAILSTEAIGTLDGQAGHLTISADTIELVGTSANGQLRSAISSEALGSSNAGDLEITAGQFSIRGGAIASTSSSASNAQSGQLTVRVSNLLELAGITPNGQLPSALSTEAQGAGGIAGNLIIDAGQLVLRDGAILVVNANNQGTAGNITITAGSVQLNNRARINSGAGNLAGNFAALNPNNAGDIRITTGGDLTLENGSGIVTGAIGGQGNSGNITIEAQNITLQNGSILGTANFGGQGRSGNISLSARDSVTFLNNSNVGTLSFGTLSEADNSAVGTISVTARRFDVQNSLFAASSLIGQGNSGNISVRVTDSIRFDGGGFTTTSQGSGSGGDISLETTDLVIRNGGSIITSSSDRVTSSQAFRLALFVFPPDQANFVSELIESVNAANLALPQSNSGNITIRASNAIEISGSSADGTSISRLFSGTEGSGNAGTISLSTRQLTIREGALISTSTSGSGWGGNLSIQADTVELSGVMPLSTGQTNLSAFSTESFGTGKAGNLTIDANQLIVREGAIVSTATVNQGQGGNLTITARDSVTLLGASVVNGQTLRSGLSAETSGTGNAGTLMLNTDRLVIQEGAIISAATFGSGQGGDITITADRINLNGVSSDRQFRSAISTETASNVSGGAGDIRISANRLNLRDGAAISTLTSGSGQGGNLVLNIRDSVELARRNRLAAGQQIFSSLSTGTTGVGNAGRLEINTRRLSGRQQGEISASTSGQGNAGDIFINARDLLNLNRSYILSTIEAGATGDAGNIRIETPALSLLNGGQIGAAVGPETRELPGGRGRGGTIRIFEADSINISGVDRNGFSSGLFANTRRGAFGRGGNISLDTAALRLANGGVITTQTHNPSRGGNITVNADRLSITGGGQIVTSTFNRGSAGDITLNANDIALSGSDPAYSQRLRQVQRRLNREDSNLRPRDIVPNDSPNSGLSAGTGRDSSNNGGSITINTTNLAVNDSARISAQSEGADIAGNININANSTLNLNDGEIVTSARQSSGGAINIAGGDVRLRNNSDIRTQVAQGAGGGGDIVINAVSLIALDDSDIIAAAVQGVGGDITFGETIAFFQNYNPANSDIQDTGSLESNGSADINATGSEPGTISLPDTSFIQNSLADLPANAVDADRLIANSCIARTESGGTFLVTGSGGLPLRPGTAPLSPYPTGEVRPGTAADESALWQAGEAIVEPQGVYQLPNGQLVMSRECD